MKTKKGIAIIEHMLGVARRREPEAWAVPPRGADPIAEALRRQFMEAARIFGTALGHEARRQGLSSEELRQLVDNSMP